MSEVVREVSVSVVVKDRVACAAALGGDGWGPACSGRAEVAPVEMLQTEFCNAGMRP